MNEPIVLLDDDEDDQLLFTAVMQDLAPERPVYCFGRASQALDYLQTTNEKPFMIVSELRLPGTDGIEFRQIIEQHEDLRKKSIPFLYLTGTIHEELVERAYELTIQGLFEKKETKPQWTDQFKTILHYWATCVHPKQQRTAD